MSFVWSSIMLASRRRPDSNPVVIPAQAGIQWFRQAIPAKRE